MSSRSLMKRKSAFTRRRLIITFIMCTILAVAIMTGFSSGLNTDNNRFTAEDQRVVMWAELPEYGTPSDFDLISNVKYTAQKIYTSPYYRGTTDGMVTANLGLGIKYTQNVHNVRVVKGDTIFSEAISSSSMKSVAEQKYFSGDTILYRAASSVSGNTATYPDSVSKMEKSVYYEKYGVRPNELTKEAINTDTILSVRDNNAAAAARAVRRNADGDGEPAVTFDVPEALVADADGNYSFTLVLDPYSSTIFSRNEVRTLAGADKNPLFHSVEISFVIDSAWTPISITTVEVYDIEIPFIGALTCTSSLTEVFSDFGDESGVVPEQDFFESHIDDAGTGSTEQQLSAADYLAAAFASYLTGTKSLDLVADIDVSIPSKEEDTPPLDIPINDLKLSVNIGNLNIYASLGGLNIAYLGDKVYLLLNDIKGYLPVDAVKGLMDDPAIKDLMSGSDGKGIDFGSLLGGDILGKVFANCEMTRDGGMTGIRLPFELAEGISVDATLLIADAGMQLRGITGELDIFGVKVIIDAKPAAGLTFPVIDDTYTDLTPAAELVPEILKTALAKTYAVSGTVTLGGDSVGDDYNITVDAYIDRTEGIAVDATVNVFDRDITVKYLDGTVYLSSGNLRLKAGKDDITALIGRLTGLFGTNTAGLNDVKALLPDTVDGWINILRSLAVTGDTITVGAGLDGVDVGLTLVCKNGLSVSLDARTDLEALKLYLDADLSVTTPERRDVTVEGTYIDVSDFNSYIDSLMGLADAESLTLNVTGYVKLGDDTISLDGLMIALDNTGETLRIEAEGAVGAFGRTLQVTYTNDTAYITLGKFNFKLAAADIATFLPGIKTALGTLGVDLGTKKPGLAAILPAVISAVDSMTSDGDAIELVLDINGEKLTVAIDFAATTLCVKGSLVGIDIDIDGSVQKVLSAVTPVDETAVQYSDLAQLVASVDKIAELIAAESFAADISAEYGDYRICGSLAVNFEHGLMARLSVPELKIGKLDLSVDLAIEGTTAFLRVTGNYDLAIAGDVLEVLDAVAAFGVLPQELVDSLRGMIGATPFMTVGGATVNVTDIVDKLYSMISYITLNDGVLRTEIDLAPLEREGFISFTANTDLSYIAVKLNGAAKDLVSLTGLTAGASVTIPDPDADYIAVDELMPLVNAIKGLTAAEGFALGIDAELFGVKIAGSVNIVLPDSDTAFVMRAALTVGDIPLTATVTGGKLYLSLNNKVNLSCSLTGSDISDLIAEITKLLPVELDTPAAEGSAISKLLASPLDLLGMGISLAHTDTGIALSIDLLPIGIDAKAVLGLDLDPDKLNGITVKVTAGARTEPEPGATADVTDITLALATETDDDGALTAISVSGLDINGDSIYSAANDAILKKAVVTVDSLDKQTLEPDTLTYVPVSALTRYVTPVYNIIDKAMTADSVTVFFNNSYVLMTETNRQLSIGGKATIGFDPLTVEAELSLLGERIYITYVDSTLYLKLGAIKLSFVMPDDIDRVIDVLGEYLPAYLTDELSRLLHPTGEETSNLSDLGLIVQRLTAFGTAATPNEKAALLFDKLHNYEGCPSLIATLLDMVGISLNGDDFMITLSFMDMPVRLTPTLVTVGDDELLNGINVDLAIGDDSSTQIHLDLHSIAFGGDTGIGAPADKAEYVSIVEFVELVNNLVHTFTTAEVKAAGEETGDIAFSIDTLDFSYAAYKKDADGNVIVTDGAKEIEKTIIVTNRVDGEGNKLPVVRGSIGDDIMLEAHVRLVGALANMYATDIDLYVLSSYTYLDTDVPEGEAPVETTVSKTAYLCYKEIMQDSEGNEVPGYGETLSIDYDSVMQIAASALGILGVNNRTVETLIKDPAHRTDINADIFRSMNIEGLDGIRDTVNRLVDTVLNAGKALDDLKAAWALVTAPDTATGDGDTPLTQQQKIDMLLGSADEIGALISRAIERFTASGAEPANAPVAKDAAAPTEITVEGFADIVNGIRLIKSGNDLGAEIDNSLTTGGDGKAQLIVVQDNGVIKSFDMTNLDVKDALVAGSAAFTAGVKADIKPDINAIIHVTDDKDKTTYSNLSNVKRLLFDIMNTANLKKFEIGAAAADKIELEIPVINNITLKYNAKVMLIDQGEAAKDRYKTAAAIEINMEKASVLGSEAIPACTTHLYFYDDYLYLSGYRWYKDEYTEPKKEFINTNPGGWPKYEWVVTGTVSKTGGAMLEPINVVYSVKEFVDMLSADDMSALMYNFLFLLVPLRIDYKFLATIDLQKTIADLVKPKYDDNGDIVKKNASPTIATVFGGYSYDSNTGKHSAAIDLGALTGDSNMSKLNIELLGANNADDATVGVRNNYVSNAHIDTTIAGAIKLKLDASLTAPTEYTDDSGKPALMPADIGTTEISGKQYKLYEVDKSLAAYSNPNADDLINDYILNPEAVTWIPYATVASWAIYEDHIDKINKNA